VTTRENRTGKMIVHRNIISREGLRRKTLKSVFLGFVLIIGISVLGSPQDVTEVKQDPYIEAIRSFIEYATKKMKVDHIPGLSVGFIKDDYFWTQGLGYSDLENQVLAKPQSSYRMASITKTFTAIAVLQLAEAGKIDLDAKVQTYVPYFPRKKWPITIRMLLGHLSGIPHYSSESEHHIKVYKDTREALKIFQDYDLVVEPGTKYHYSTYGYNLLGAVIEGASRQSYRNYIKENIFKPLGMTNSQLESAVDLIPNRVRGYRFINGRIWNSEYVDISSRFAGGGTRSTAVDLLKYARGICEGKLLKPETWKAMFASMATRDGYLTNYGMGWRVYPWKGHFQVSHGGSQPETITHLLIFPSEKFAVAGCTNLEKASLLPYVRKLAELVLNQDLDSTACLQTFSYGLSHHDYFGDTPAVDPKDLKKAFEYFNKNVNSRAINIDPKRIAKKLNDGIHPVAHSPFTMVGAYMASMLEKALGKERLQDYCQNNLRFFSDYIRLKGTDYKLSRNISQQLARWEKDWTKAYPEFIRHLYLSEETDLDNLLPQLREAFDKTSIYPDLSQEFRDIAGTFIARKDMKRALQILDASVEFYPDNPYNLLSLGNAHLLAGDKKKARSLYKKSHNLLPVDPRYLERMAADLGSTNTTQELLALTEIFSDLYSKNAGVQQVIASIYLKLGKKEMAIKHYKRTLKLDPNLKEARKKLQELLKK
jgi:CubicO group peptidase (beta-lactamase class C family)/tetratricopeptide (TPR) repeat protein